MARLRTQFINRYCTQEYENADDADPNGNTLASFAFRISVNMIHLDIATTRAWPTTMPEAAEALASVSDTHVVCPLPAYDQNGILIEPRWYVHRLEGATVVLRFELNHYVIRNKRDKGGPPTDAFSARIVQLRVVIPPPAASPVTPRKRKVLPSDSYFGCFTPRKDFKKDDDGSDKENNDSVVKYLRFVD